MSVLRLAAAKGGQGTTTVAAAVAVLSAMRQETVAVGEEDLAAVFGMPLSRAVDGWEQVILPQLTFSRWRPEDSPEKLVVVDEGLVQPNAARPLVEGAVTLLVTRCCYLALLGYMRAPFKVDGIVVVAEPARALGEDDVASVIGVPVVATVPWRPEVARAVDAGVLAARLPPSLMKPVAKIVDVALGVPT